MYWKNLKIAHKLTISFSFSLFAFILFGIFTMISMNGIKDAAQDVSIVQLPTVKKVAELERNWQQAIFYLRSYGYSKNKQFLYDGLTHLQFTKDILEETKRLLAEDDFLNDQLRLLSNELQSFSAVVKTAQEMIEKQQVNTLLLDDEMDNGILLIQLLSETLFQKAAMAVDGNINQASHAKNMVFITIIALTLISLLVSRFLTNSFTAPIYQLVKFADLQANGELNYEFELKQNDEIGKLANSIYTSNKVIKEMVIKLTHAAQSIKNASDRFSDKATNLNDHATSQASSSEELSASMEEMTLLITQNANDAKKINQINEVSTNTLNQEMDQTHRAMKIMDELINKSVRIKEIAMQTNILALNANIEAAKAGSYGRGFGAVAKGIRELAERSRDISSDINSVSANGKEYSSLAGASLNKIQKESQQSTQYIQKISDSAMEQQSESTQISNAVMQFNDHTQRIAIMAEDMSEESKHLKKESLDMQKMLKFFSVDGIIKMDIRGTKRKTLKKDKHSTIALT